MPDPSGLHDALVQAAAEAMWRRDYRPMGPDWFSEHVPEKWHRELAERAVAAVLPLLADAVEASEVDHPAHWHPEWKLGRTAANADAAALIRSATGQDTQG